MTIKRLKEIIENLPDDIRIYADDGGMGMFTNNSEFVLAVPHSDMCVLQTKNDFDVNNEITAWYNVAKNNGVDANAFWKEFYEIGYDYDDFIDPKMQEEALKFRKVNLNV